MKKNETGPKGRGKKDMASIAGLSGQIMKQTRGAEGAQDQPQQDKYMLTPRGVLVVALSEFIKNVKDMTTFEKLVEYVNEVEQAFLEGLSRIATNGERDNLFGSDINAFFRGYVTACNEAGRMRQLLIDNGINPDEGKDTI